MITAPVTSLLCPYSLAALSLVFTYERTFQGAYEVKFDEASVEETRKDLVFSEFKPQASVTAHRIQLLHPGG